MLEVNTTDIGILFTPRPILWEFDTFLHTTCSICRSHWPCGLRHRSAVTRLLGLRDRIPPGTWMYVSCKCCVLSGRGLCGRLIQWRTEGGFGCSNPPRNSEGPPQLCKIQPDLRKLLKIAKFRSPTPQDVRKKGSKILKLPRFAIVLYKQ